MRRMGSHSAVLVVVILGIVDVIEVVHVILVEVLRVGIAFLGLSGYNGGMVIRDARMPERDDCDAKG